MLRGMAALAVVGLVGCGSSQALDVGVGPPDGKVYVCKYVGKPGVDERLQTGQNPISVSVHALENQIGPFNIGDEFEDAQGRSVVIGFDNSVGGGQHGEPAPDCPPPPPPPTTTTTPPPPPPTVTTTTTTTTSTTSTTTLPPDSTVPTTPPPSVEGIFISAVGTTCQGDVPVILIEFGDQTEFNGRVGTLTFIDLNGVVIETRSLAYQAGQVVVELYPGASVDPVSGEATDWPGWVLQPNGLWVEDPTDALWRQGLTLVYEVNPTSTTQISYPPASSACASPENPPGTNGLLPPAR